MITQVLSAVKGQATLFSNNPIVWEIARGCGLKQVGEYIKDGTIYGFNFKGPNEIAKKVEIMAKHRESKVQVQRQIRNEKWVSREKSCS